MKYWVFDLDGTLTDSFAPYFATVEHFLDEPLSREDKKNFIGMHPSYIFSSRLPAEKAMYALEALKDRSQKEASSIPLFNEMYTVCSWLTQNGCRISVWTSRDLDSTKLVLKGTGIFQFVDHVISGDCVAQRKPHPEGLSRIKNLFSCESCEMVMVGDHDHDICRHAHRQFYNTLEFQTWVKQVIPKVTEVRV